jgi:hypothetical protein
VQCSDDNPPAAVPGRRLVLLICCLAALPTIILSLMQALYGGLMTDIRAMLELGGFGAGLMAAAFSLPAVVLQRGARSWPPRLATEAAPHGSR